ncbi:coronin-6-like [Ptychodera flava]|uniref:coronin-6-like n=1 Tax=Ptychodera flava TaxID=63121 RepID=UPI003969D204
MSLRVVRSSKYRHVYGQPARKEHCYDGLKVTSTSHDGQFCAVNPKFIAVCLAAAGGGAFIVLKHSDTGRIDMNFPRVTGHKAEVLDLAWSPFNDNYIASASEDTTIKIWDIPDEGLKQNMDDPLLTLEYHQKRVLQILWHPSAENILLSTGHDDLVVVWNLDTGSVLCEIGMPTSIFSACWNHNGSLIATTTKDKMIRVLDPRTGDVKQAGKGHEGAKPQRVVFLKDNKLFTTGFSRMSERQYALWDASDLSNSAILETLDTSNGILFPLYDPDTGLIFLTGKGDSNIRYFEVSDEPPFVHYLSTFSSSTPQRGVGMMTKRGCNVNSCEVAKIYKVHQRGLCEPIAMIVPRKSELFQADIFPDTASDKPALTAEEWQSGKDADPLTMSMKSFYVDTAKDSRANKSKGGLGGLGGLKKTVKAVAPVEEPEEEKPKPRAAVKVVAAAPEPEKEQPAPPPVVKEEPPAPKVEPPAPKKVEPPVVIVEKPKANAASDDQIQELMEEIRSLRKTVEDHEKRIKDLEEQLEENN